MGESLIVNNGKKIILDRTYNDDGSTTFTAPIVFKIGTNQVTAISTATDLTNPVPFSGEDIIDDCESITGWVDSADMTVSLNTTTFVIGTAAINLTKDGTGSADANTEKTTTTLDFTDQQFSIRLFILDAPALAKLAVTDALEIRFGSTSGDYFTWTKDASELSVGNNLIQGLTVSNADSTTGTPIQTAMDYTRIQLTATGAGITWSAGDFIMDDIKAVASADFIKAFTSQTIDLLNLEVETRLNLSSVEANGNLLSGLGVFNSDSPRLLFSLDDFAEESKSNTDEFIFIIKDRFA